MRRNTKRSVKHKIATLIGCFLLISAMPGCQLARENMGADTDMNTSGDKLAGVFVTTENLDLFDFESYLTDNLSGFQGGEITVGGDTTPYQGRLYATLTTKKLTDEQTGETSEIEEYVFDGVDGIAFFTVTMPEPDTSLRGSYTSSIINEGVSDGHTGINQGDDEVSFSLEGIIYTVATGKNQIYYFNPVYQRADGRVYVTEGSGLMISQDSTGEGSVFSHTLDDTKTVTENGKTKTENMSVKLSVSVIRLPEKTVVLQMDAQNRLIAREEYPLEKHFQMEYVQEEHAHEGTTKGIMPEAFTPKADTAYLIVETYERDNAGDLKISRAIYGKEDESFDTFVARPDGICIKNWTQIKWD